MGGRSLAVRATPQEYFNRQPTVQAIEQPVTVQQADSQSQVIVVYPQDNTKLIIVAGVIIIGVISVVAIAAFFSRR